MSSRHRPRSRAHRPAGRSPSTSAAPSASSGTARLAAPASPPPEAAYTYEDATVTLALADVDDREEPVTLRVPVGPVALDALVPTARALSRRVTLRVLASEEAAGRPATCRPGCDACCHHLIPVSGLEARALARAVAALDAPARARVEARAERARARLREEGLLPPDAPPGSVALYAKGADAASAWSELSRRYFSLRITCPLLEERRCVVHEHAPLVCREYHASTEPTRCDSLDGGARAHPRPIRGSEALSAAAADAAGVSPTQLPLALALDWARVHGATLDGAFDGERLFEALARAIAEQAG